MRRMGCPRDARTSHSSPRTKAALAKGGLRRYNFFTALKTVLVLNYQFNTNFPLLSDHMMPSHVLDHNIDCHQRHRARESVQGPIAASRSIVPVPAHHLLSMTPTPTLLFSPPDTISPCIYSLYLVSFPCSLLGALVWYLIRTIDTCTSRSWQ